MAPKQHLPLLTPLRGFAAGFVVLYHILHLFPALQPAQGTSAFFDKGFLWVDLFFILSGFVMLHSYQNSFQIVPQAATYKKFMIARFCRIYPLHFVTLSVLFSLEVFKLFVSGRETPAFGSNESSLIGLISQLFLLQAVNLTPYLSWNIPSWSIGAEWVTYLFFPFLVAPISRLRVRSVLILCTFLLSFITLLGYKYNTMDITHDLGFLRCMLEFCFGAGLYRLYKLYFSQNPVSSFRLGLILAVALFTLHSAHSWWIEVAVVALFGALVLAGAASQNRLAEVLDNKFTNFLGDISYSIYMWHYIFIYFLCLDKLAISRRFSDMNFIESLISCLGVFTLLILTSHVSFRLIELRLGKALKNWLSQPRSRPKSNLAPIHDQQASL